jgi:hypothetical protein
MKSLLAAICILSAFLMSTFAQAADGPYRHVVLFKFKDSASKEQIQKVEEQFVALKSKIDTVVSLEWGTNVSPENHAEGFTHCFFVTFKDKSGVETYLPHPAHKAFVEILHPILDKVIVVDYVAQK